MRVPTCDMSVARPRTNAQRACAVATYDLVTYERSHRLTSGGRSTPRIQGVLLSTHRGIRSAHPPGPDGYITHRTARSMRRAHGHSAGHRAPIAGARAAYCRHNAHLHNAHPSRAPAAPAAPPHASCLVVPLPPTYRYSQELLAVQVRRQPQIPWNPFSEFSQRLKGIGSSAIRTKFT